MAMARFVFLAVFAVAGAEILSVDLDAAWSRSVAGHRKVFTAAELAAAPDAFDPFVAWPHCNSTLGAILDSSACGAAWGMAAVEAMSDRFCLAGTARDGELLSAEDMLACNDDADGCDGGLPSLAYEYFAETGVVTERCRPYSLPGCDHHIPGSPNPCPAEPHPTPQCVRKCVNGKSWEQEKHRVAKAYTVSGEAAIKAELSSSGPCEAVFSVYEDFLAYAGGVYKHSSGAALGGHAVKILGYGTDRGIPFWLLANSFNANWGERGFFRMIRGRNDCGIETTIWCGTPAL
jgi:cathepsin B